MHSAACQKDRKLPVICIFRRLCGFVWREWAAAESNVIALDCRCLACACVPTTQLVSTARGASRSTMTDPGGRPTEAVVRATRARVRTFGYGQNNIDTDFNVLPFC